MKLTDREILELNELCGAVIDGTLTDAQQARLNELLRGSEVARRYCVLALGQSASLHTYAAEIHAEAPDRPQQRSNVLRVSAWVFGALAAAAALVFVLRDWTPLASGAAGAARRANDVVARVSAVKDTQWSPGTTPLAPGARLRKGQRIDLRAGFAEITFDSGARVVLEGATSIDVNSAWDALLRHGTLKASVPPEAIGFRVANSSVDVVDLGTEFTMIADGKGAADVLVLKGEVEASSRAPSEENTILLREKEARRFDGTGVSNVSDSDDKFSHFAQPLALDRFAPKLSYVHWAFDETAGAVSKADADPAVNAADSELRIYDAADLAAARPASDHGHALRFDGRMFAKARFPGISGSAPRTVAFWVKVAADAQPIDTWMVAWGTSVKKLGGRPVQISWNRRPAEGALGALRTDFGGGYAIGTTSLRDGKWHHIAVYFAPGDADDPAPQVKQYIDGRLESSTIVPGTVRAPATGGEMAVTDVVWLGYRLTGKLEGRRFRGELDELFITDRGLEPSEIVALMRDNRPPVLGLAALR